LFVKANPSFLLYKALKEKVGKQVYSSTRFEHFGFLIADYLDDYLDEEREKTINDKLAFRGKEK
jgi:hypothetical protein